MKESYTAVVARNVDWRDDWVTEPYECAWADEAIFFVRVLHAQGEGEAHARVQISPDGMRWADEGTRLVVPPVAGLHFVRVRHFGGYLRLAGFTAPGSTLRVMCYLSLKG